MYLETENGQLLRNRHLQFKIIFPPDLITPRISPPQRERPLLTELQNQLRLRAHLVVA
jgi:hypothetical protein